MALCRGNKNTPDIPTQEPGITPVAPSGVAPYGVAPSAITTTAGARPTGGRSLLMLSLGGLGLLTIATLGLTACSHNTEDDASAPAAMPAKAPASGAAKAPAGVPVAEVQATPHKVAIAVAAQPAKAGTPGKPATVRKVPVGAIGIAPPGAKGAVLQPAVPGQPARMVPVHGIPTPILPAPGQAAQPGKSGGKHEVTIVRPVHPTPSSAAKPNVSPQVQAQLKKLWNEGAAAKRRKDYKAARQAWQNALKLAPGWPGFQDAINKLPS